MSRRRPCARAARAIAPPPGASSARSTLRAAGPLRLAHTLMSSSGMAAPAWLQGAWQRTLLRTPDGDDTTTLVRYVQTPSLFVDLRVAPAPSTPRPGQRWDTLADLDDAGLDALAHQQGFAGHTTAEGRVCTWHRRIDLQPAAPVPDTGRCEPDGPRALLEHGIHARYVERWERLEDGDGPFAALERAGPPHEILVLAGDHFAHARGRTVPLPPSARSLAEACAGATREQRLAWLDCAVSWGRVRGTHAWMIRHSTIPVLEGRRLLDPHALRLAPDGRTLVDAAARTSEQPWSVRDGAATLQALLRR